MQKFIKPACEYIPLALFFIVYKFYGLINATAILVVATILAVSASYILLKKIPLMPILAAVPVTIFGVLTVYTGDEYFIKVKPTILNLVFSCILFVGYLKNKGLLKLLLGSNIKMSDYAWKIFSLRWAILFIFLAVLNEVIWRNFSTDFWVKFKVFGMTLVTFSFLICQLPFLKKNIIEDEEEI